MIVKICENLKGKQRNYDLIKIFFLILFIEILKRDVKMY